MTQKLTLTVLLFLVLTGPLSEVMAQDERPLYTSTYEKEIFTRLEEMENVKPLEILLALDYDSAKSVRTQALIGDLVQEIKQSGVSKKKTKKQIDYIYNYIHDAQLRHYIEDADFYQIFKDGEYNCAGASALYALVFDQMGIEYKIVEEPTHVYLVADPHGCNIQVETTLPTNGTMEINYKQKRAYVLYLRENKVIPDSEFESTSMEQLYEKYSIKNNYINLHELAGILYYNKAVGFYNQQQYTQASQNYEKAYAIYPSINIEYMWTSSLKNSLIQQQSKKIYDPYTLMTFINLKTENKENLVLGLEFFRSISREMGIDNPNVQTYKDYYSVFSAGISEDIDLDEFNQIYYRTIAYNSYANSDYYQAMNYLNFAYISNPENNRTKELILNCASQYLITNGNYEASIDSLDYYFDEFPFLGKNPKFQQFHTYCILSTAYKYYTFNEKSKGKQYLLQFEQIMRENPSYSYQAEFVESVYSSIAIKYYEDEQFGKGNQMIKKGLEFEPNSVSLNTIQREMKEYEAESAAMLTTTSNIPLSRQEQFKVDIENYFSGCWEIAQVINKEGQRIRPKSAIKIDLQEGKKVEFTLGEIKQHGKWSVRYKSRVLYLIPERDKNDYTMFKVETISSSEIKIRTFENKKMTPYKITLMQCQQR